MKKMSLIISSLCLLSSGLLTCASVHAKRGASAYHNPDGKIHYYECEEDLMVAVNYTINKANISYKGDVLTRCENRDVIVKGEVHDYGEGQTVIRCRGGEVDLDNDYDELVLRPSPQIQKIYKSMKEFEYFCEEV